jgi:hypothetical protein
MHEVICNRMNPEKGVCRGCNVTTILWAKSQKAQEVDAKAKQISEDYCPTESGGIDQTTRNTVYNQLVGADNNQVKPSAW